MRIALIVCLLILSGCSAKYPEMANLTLTVPGQAALVYSNATVSIRGDDARKTPEVISYKIKKNQIVKVSSSKPVLAVVSEHLSTGLLEQGLFFDSSSPAQIKLELNQLHVTVIHAGALYNSEALIQLTINVTNGKTTLTRKYNRQEDRQTVLRPKVSDLEEMLNSELSNIVVQILSDRQVQELIAQQ